MGHGFSSFPFISNHWNTTVGVVQPTEYSRDIWGGCVFANIAICLLCQEDLFCVID